MGLCKAETNCSLFLEVSPGKKRLEEGEGLFFHSARGHSELLGVGRRDDGSPQSDGLLLMLGDLG